MQFDEECWITQLFRPNFVGGDPGCGIAENFQERVDLHLVQFGLHLSLEPFDEAVLVLRTHGRGTILVDRLHDEAAYFLAGRVGCVLRTAYLPSIAEDSTICRYAPARISSRTSADSGLRDL